MNFVVELKEIIVVLFGILTENFQGLHVLALYTGPTGVHHSKVGSELMFIEPRYLATTRINRTKNNIFYCKYFSEIRFKWVFLLNNIFFLTVEGGPGLPATLNG